MNNRVALRNPEGLSLCHTTPTPAQLFKPWLSTVLLEIFSLSIKVAIETEVTSDIRSSISALGPV